MTKKQKTMQFFKLAQEIKKIFQERVEISDTICGHLALLIQEKLKTQIAKNAEIVGIITEKLEEHEAIEFLNKAQEEILNQ